MRGGKTVAQSPIMKESTTMSQGISEPVGTDQGLVDGVGQAPWLQAHWADMAILPAKPPTTLDKGRSVSSAAYPNQELTEPAA